MGKGLIQMPRSLGGAKREIGHAPEDSDSGAKEEAEKQRRKIQNRKNQRAHRQRLKGKDAGASQAAPRPFKVARWRLDELEPEPDVRPSNQTSPASDGASTTHVESPRQLHTYARGSSPPTTEQAIIPTHHIPSQAQAQNQNQNQSSSFTFPLSSDHLLHLIQYNVLRALLTNKLSLKLDIPSGDDPEGTTTACPISGQYTRRDNTTSPIIHPDDVVPLVTFPPSLAPTPLQKNHDHPIWVNAIPFPRVRDNFIRHAGRFNPWHLLYDLVGELMSSTPAQCVASHPKPTTTAAREARRFFEVLSSPGGGSVDGADDDEITAGRRGLIVWGEPHEAQSWEVTPGFLARWAWAVEGCEEELVEVSNRWRVRRGEEPMRLSVVRR